MEPCPEPLTAVTMTGRENGHSGRVPFGLIALSPACAAAGFLSGAALLLPLLSAAPAYGAMVLLLRQGRRRAAIAAMLVWALLLGASMTGLCAAMPEREARVVLHGPGYWDEMRVWLETGEGRESHPARFVPQHFLHAGAFVMLCLISGSLLGVLFGAALMNFMAYYVAHVAAATGAHPVLAGVLAWPPWSVVRIASFVALGVYLSEPILSRLWIAPPPARGARLGIGLAALGLALDILLKGLLAPHWPALLRSLR